MNRSLEKNGKMNQTGRQIWETSHNFTSPNEMFPLIIEESLRLNSLRQETTARGGGGFSGVGGSFTLLSYINFQRLM